MAWTALNGKDVEELFDSPEVLDQKVRTLAQLVTGSKYFSCFTGAGISTSTGIRDYRGPTGVWTYQAQAKTFDGPQAHSLKVFPSPSHMALVGLQQAHRLHYLTSQNSDGLHRRSGFPADRMSEIHGNSNLERCPKCKKEYLRDYDASASYLTSCHDHKTGRFCSVTGCGAELEDSIINFGDNLPEAALQSAFDSSDKADLCLVLGSSLTVTPACDIPKRVAKRGKNLVIVNLQRTPLDDLCSLRIFARCDEVMLRLMELLHCPIPKFYLRRRLAITQLPGTPGTISRLEFQGVDEDGTAFGYIRKLKLEDSTGQVLASTFKEPFNFPLKHNVASVTAKLYFRGHYDEPRVALRLSASGASTKQSHTLQLLYDPEIRQWSVGPAPGAPQQAVVSVVGPAEDELSDEEMEDAETAVTHDKSNMFYVEPKRDCPHVDKFFNLGQPDEVVFNAFKKGNSCTDCHDSEENWICLSCYKVFCSRYKNGHMAAHNQTNQPHCLAMSFSDLSVWCYQCSSYIAHGGLQSKLNALHEAKFGVCHPGSIDVASAVAKEKKRHNK